MSMYSSFIGDFQNPQYSAAQAAAILLFFSFLFYRIPTHFSKENDVRYWRIIAFSSELLVAVGLIGLLTFMGRASIDERKLKLAEAVSVSERKIGNSADAFGGFCTLPIKETTPFNLSGPIEKFCSGRRSMISLYNPKIDWERTSQDFLYVSQSSRVSPEVSFHAKQFAESIKELLVTRRALEAELQWGEKIRAKPSVNFLILAALMAILGVSMKCARTANELRITWKPNDK